MWVSVVLRGGVSKTRVQRAFRAGSGGWATHNAWCFGGSRWLCGVASLDCVGIKGKGLRGKGVGCGGMALTLTSGPGLFSVHSASVLGVMPLSASSGSRVCLTSGGS